MSNASKLCRLKREMNLDHIELNELLLNVLELSTVGFCSWDLITNEVYLSDEIFKIIGHDKSDFDGSMEYLLDNYIDDSYKQMFIESVNYDISNRSTKLRVFKVKSKGSNEIWMRVYGKFIFDDHGVPKKYIGAALDISCEIEKENRLSCDLSFLKTMIETLPSPVFYKNDNGVYKYTNAAFLDFLGFNKDEIIDKTVYDVYEPEIADIYHNADLELIMSKSTQSYETKVLYNDGSLRDVVISKAIHKDEEDNIKGVVGVMYDVSSEKEKAGEIELLHRIKDVFLNLNTSILNSTSELDLFKEILLNLFNVFSESTACCMLEVTGENMIKSVVSIGYDEGDIQEFCIPLETCYIWKETSGNIEKSVVINDIERLKKENCTDTVKTISGDIIRSSLTIPVYISGVIKWLYTFDSPDKNCFTKKHVNAANYIIEELPLIYNVYYLFKKSLYLSRYDILTGFMSRSYFEQVFEDRLMLSIRNKINLIVVLFDLDGLKKVNDRYGHESGDTYIKTFADTLKQTYRKTDIFSRIGGDEFVGLFINTSKEALDKKISDIREIFENMPIYNDEHTFYGSFSYGMSEYPDSGEEKEKLLKIADENMYKDKGRLR